MKAAVSTMEFTGSVGHVDVDWIGTEGRRVVCPQGFVTDVTVDETQILHLTARP